MILPFILPLVQNSGYKIKSFSFRKYIYGLFFWQNELCPRRESTDSLQRELALSNLSSSKCAYFQRDFYV